jgi:hypothetical protein
MSEAIDFTEWTTAQLRAAERFADRSPNGPALLAEIARRTAAGTLDDGSEQRVSDFLKRNRRRTVWRER